MFEDDLWDLTAVIGLPTQMGPSLRRFDFTAITNLRWRTVAKELVLALLAPRHPAVAPLPRAYRTALHVKSAHARLAELVRWLNWLAQRDCQSLAEVDDRSCEEYLAHRTHIRDANGVSVGERSPTTRREAIYAVTNMINYRELFSADRVPASLRPWGGAAPSAIVAMRYARAGENTTPPVPDSILQPMMAAALYLVTVIGPHTVDLARQVRDADRVGPHSGTLPSFRREIVDVLAEYEREGRPLPLLPEYDIRERIAAGWAADDLLTPLGLDALARQAGQRRFRPGWITHLRPAIERTLAAVGAQNPFGREVASVERADGHHHMPCTLPLHRRQALTLIGVVRTAAIILIAGVSGMRSSELMELNVGCRRPPETYGPDLVRYRLASTVVKGQPLGGVDDEWVVIEPAYQAVDVVERLHDDPREGGAPVRPVLVRRPLRGST